ncbi:MAG: gamma-glutamyl-gamma-aminobutyrate hydrolase family protein [Pseudomonadota bacterium]
MRPTVGIPCCTRQVGLHPFHIAGDKYIRAVTDGAGAFVVCLPALGEAYDWHEVLPRLDGLLITGSPSDVHPTLYGGPPSAEGALHDAERDATTLPLIRAALDVGMPLLAICRGIQELNVALGGTLHQDIAAIDGRFNHNPDPELSAEQQYAPAHPVHLTQGSVLARMFGTEKITVNSIHRQGVDRLGDGLAVEATAEDGQIEAVRVANAKGFALGLQWHPEWRFWENEQSMTLFRAFGTAVAEFAAGPKSVAAE